MGSARWQSDETPSRRASGAGNRAQPRGHRGGPVARYSVHAFAILRVLDAHSTGGNEEGDSFLRIPWNTETRHQLASRLYPIMRSMRAAITHSLPGSGHNVMTLHLHANGLAS